MAKAPAKPRKTAPAAKRPAHLPRGRWLGDFPDLSDAELGLVAACAAGEFLFPEGLDGENPMRPTESSPENTIRGELVRFLALGGDSLHPVHEEGVMIIGCWISGELNLHQASSTASLNLHHCHFAETAILSGATLAELVLLGSKLPRLEADQLRVKGCVDLVHGFEVTGGVQLRNAQIGGDLDCDGGKFGDSDHFSLNLQGANVIGALFFRGAHFAGPVYMAAAKIGTLVDGDLSCLQAPGHVLDGLRYNQISGNTNAASRIFWLKQQRSSQLTTHFAPQPWEQLIKVLRDMGHPFEASQVAIAKQEQLRAAGVIKGRVRNAMHWLYGKIAGYGYRPIWTVYWMIGMWLACTGAFQLGREAGYFGPSNPLIHASVIFDKCGAPGEGKHFWTSTDCPTPPEYSTMFSPVYSLDLILPLVDLQQDADWAPIVVNSKGTQLWWGHALRLLMWFEILFGWAASLVLVAVLGRLVEKD